MIGDPRGRVVRGDVERQRRAADLAGRPRRGPRPPAGCRGRRRGRRRARATLAIASPIPREAPVTSATLPCERRSHVDAVGRPRPLRRPARPDRTRTPSAARAGSGAWIPGSPRRRARRRRAVRCDPRRTSLPTERVNPSRARWAVASRGFEHASGGVPSTITRPDFSTRRIVGWKNSRSAPRPGESVIPVASKTRALNRASAGASGIPDRGVEAGLARGVANLVAQLASAPRRRLRRGRPRPGRRAGRQAPRRAGPRRRSPAGPARSGRARPAAEARRARRSSPPIRLLTICEYVSWASDGLLLRLLENRDDALATGGADRDQAAAAAALVERLREPRDDPPAGGRERVRRPPASRR